MKKIIIAGGSGYIGQAFFQKFKTKYNIKILSRSTSEKYNYITAIESCDVLMNLAGASIFPNRWTSKRKQELLDSRVKYSANLLQDAKLFSINHYIQASATTFYPFSESEIFTEDCVKQSGLNFSLNLVQEWEAQIEKSSIQNNSIVRLGVVVGPKSKFLEPMKLLYSFFLGGMIGSGRQWISWVHVADVIDAIDFMIEKQLTGPVNVTSPNAITNKDMCELLAAILKRPNFFHMPKWFYQSVFGEASELLIEGHQIYPKTLLDKGYKFKFDQFEEALKDSI